MLGKTRPRGYREEVKKKESLQTNRHTGGQKDDGQRLSRKAESGELKKKSRITREPEPELEPPALLVGSCGFLTGPVEEVQLFPEKHKSSHTDLPRMRPP